MSDLVLGLVATTKLCAGFEPPTCEGRHGERCIVGPAGWIDQQYGRLRYTLWDRHYGYFRPTEMAAAMAALINIGVATLEESHSLNQIAGRFHINA